MSNLTADKADERQEGVLIDVAVAASTKIFKGSNVSANAAGFGKKASDTAGEDFLGVAMETVDNTAGQDGDKRVRVWAEGLSSMTAAGATQAWVGRKVYAVDDQTVALAATTTNDVLVGTVKQFVSATEVRVKI